MNTKGILRACLLLLVIWGAMVSFAGGVWQGKCVAVADGDTATVLLEDNTEAKLRFWGIDAPEKSQDFGQIAKKRLSDLIYGKTVRVEVQNKDRYSRYVAKVYQDGVYINERMVKDGLAWHYKQYAPKDNDLAKAEQGARKAKKGLWKHSDPTAPWEYRRKPKKEVSPEGAFWVTDSGVVHHSSCKYYGSTKAGSYTNKPEGEPCGLCAAAIAEQQDTEPEDDAWWWKAATFILFFFLIAKHLKFKRGRRRRRHRYIR